MHNIDYVCGTYWKNFLTNLEHIHSTMPLRVPCKDVYESHTYDEFDASWQSLLECYNLEDNA